MPYVVSVVSGFSDHLYGSPSLSCSLIQLLNFQYLCHS